MAALDISYRVITPKLHMEKIINGTVEPLLSGLLRCGHLPLPTSSRIELFLFCLFLSNQFGWGIRFGRVRAHGDYHTILRATLYRFSFTDFHTRRNRSMLTLEKKLEIIGELKKGKSLRYLS